MAILLWWQFIVDDIIITGNDDQENVFLKQHLNNKFTIKDLGILHYFLGIEVSYSSKGLNLTQHGYINELLKESGLTSFTKVATPLPMYLKLLSNEGNCFMTPLFIGS